MQSLEEFINPSATKEGKPLLKAMRLHDTCGVNKAIIRAKKRIGLPYDYTFQQENNSYYCSELIWECYLRPDHTPIFEAHPMNFRAADGTMPQYWIDLYEQLGEAIPEGELGTNPNRMSQSEELHEVKSWY